MRTLCLLALATTGLVVAGMIWSDRLSVAEEKTSNPLPEELGRVAWLRDYSQALQAAKKSRKPMLLLFDEVPGCSTCKQFGANPLSHPLIVDAAEEFVPIAIYNNVGGKDAEILKRFSEPAWNNPVVRFLDENEKDVIPRKEGVYSVAELVDRMVLALEKAERKVPEFLRLVRFEQNPKSRDVGVFAMYCYWEGERKLGSLEGVLSTRIGSLGGAEVVEVEFDPSVLSFEKLVASAKEMDCTHRVFARTQQQLEIARKIVGEKATLSTREIDADTQQQYHLAHYSVYHYLPLTRLQATKVNALLAAEKRPDAVLSPGQLKRVQQISQKLKADPKALRDLRPDRSPKGINAYARELDRVLGQ
jgi:hypothetical protein